jgi:hypothetical protein
VEFHTTALGCGPDTKFWTSIIGINPVSDRGFTNFYLFAGILIGYLIWYLEELSKLIYQRLHVDETNNEPEICHEGLGHIYDWINRIVKVLDRPN